jgi:hypothetical protein
VKSKRRPSGLNGHDGAPRAIAVPADRRRTFPQSSDPVRFGGGAVRWDASCAATWPALGGLLRDIPFREGHCFLVYGRRVGWTVRNRSPAEYMHMPQTVLACGGVHLVMLSVHLMGFAVICFGIRQSCNHMPDLSQGRREVACNLTAVNTRRLYDWLFVPFVTVSTIAGEPD